MRRVFFAAVFLSSVSCGPDEAASTARVERGQGGETAYGDSTDVVVVSGDKEQSIITGADGEPCVQVDERTCVAVDEVTGRYCEGEEGQADIILDEDGEVLTVICYPPANTGTPLEEVGVSEDGTVAVPQNAGGAVIVFDPDTNQTPIQGDVRLDAERVTLFGNGAGETILEGDLNLASNNARARGFTVTGDLIIEKNSNNNAITFCEVLGSLSAQSNGLRVVDCVVFGDVTVSGNGATLVNVGVQGAWNVDSKSACHGCYSFTDENKDGALADDERGDALLCD